MIIGVGSTNPVKINGTRKAVHRYNSTVQVVAFSAASGISNMPLSKEETRIGAKNRALDTLRQLLVEYPEEHCIGVGNEGGIAQVDGLWYLFGSTYATDGDLSSYGAETVVRLPDAFVHPILTEGIELGEVMDRYTGDHNTKQKGGAIAILTNNVVLREDLFYTGSVQALAPWFNQLF